MIRNLGKLGVGALVAVIIATTAAAVVVARRLLASHSDCPDCGDEDDND